MPESVIKLINDQNPPPLLLLFGEEEFLISRSTDLLITKFTNPPLNYQFEKYDGGDVTLDDIVLTANTSSFFGEKKLVLIKDFDKSIGKIQKKNIENTKFYKYLSNPNENTFLVLQSNNSNLNGLSKSKTKASNLPYPYNIIVQKYLWVEYPKVWPSEFENWVRKAAKNLKLELEPDATQMLISRSGESLRTLWNELEKLQIFMGGNSKVTLEDVLEVAGSSKELNVFDLQKAVIKKDLKTAVKIINEILRYDRQEMLIISVLQKLFLQLFKLSEMDLNQNKYALAQKIGVNAFFLDDYLNALKKYTPNQIVNALDQLMFADEQIKSFSSDNLFIMVRMITNIVNGQPL